MIGVSEPRMKELAVGQPHEPASQRESTGGFDETEAKREVCLGGAEDVVLNVDPGPKALRDPFEEVRDRYDPVDREPVETRLRFPDVELEADVVGIPSDQVAVGDRRECHDQRHRQKGQSPGAEHAA